MVTLIAKQLKGKTGEKSTKEEKQAASQLW